jgi:hypothetical protein
MRDGPERRLGRGALVRGAGVALVFVLTLTAFAVGVGTAAGDEIGARSFVAWFYYAGGLFVFGGLDLGAPVGGPAWGRAALWAAYFLAPTITTTALVEAVLRLIRPARGATGAMAGHVVVVGSGQVGLAYLQAVRAVEPDVPILLLDRADRATDLLEVERMGGVEVVRADPRRPATLDLLALEGAARMIVVTDDDLVNLELAWGASQSVPNLPVAVHVADLTLLRPVNRLVRDQAASSAVPAHSPLVFNTHRIGALHLYERFLHPHFEETQQRDVVVIGGFGRFAQTILELLRVTAAADLAQVIIVDAEASRLVRQFEADVPLGDLSLVTVDGDLEDPGTWARVETSLVDFDVAPVFLLASSNEVVNLRAAMFLRGRSPQARVFARCFHRGRFGESLAEQREFELLAFEDVLREALVDHYQGLRTL